MGNGNSYGLLIIVRSALQRGGELCHTTAELTAGLRPLLTYMGMCSLPLAASSVQLIGQKGGVEQGRAANLIQLFGGAITIKLSSAAVPDPDSDDIILIGPPFYLEVIYANSNQLAKTHQAQQLW